MVKGHYKRSSSSSSSKIILFLTGMLHLHKVGYMHAGLV